MPEKANFENAILEGGPKDGTEIWCNRDYDDTVVVMMPQRISVQYPRGEQRLIYYRTKREKDGRQVYEFRSNN